MLIQRAKNILKVSLLSFTLLINVSAQDIFFKHLTVENGLSNNKVNCMLEDHLGFIWFGTEDGLNRFDGYDLKIYRHQPDDKSSISSNDIWTLFEDSDGFIWIGTKAGEINKYDPKLDKFESWKVGATKYAENSVTCIFKDSKKNLWIGTYRNGLYLFDTNNQKFFNWKYHPENDDLHTGQDGSLSNNYITSILEDDKGNLWISTYNGLNKFNPAHSENTFVRYYFNPADASTISNNLIWNLIPSKNSKSKFWIGTAKGLDLYNSENSSITRLSIPFEKELQFGASVGSIVEDSSDSGSNYWIGTYAGLVKTNAKSKTFIRYKHEGNNSLSLINNQINVLVKDKSGVIWIATENGVSYVSQKEVRFNLYLAEKKLSSNFDKLRRSSITAISQSNDGTVWLGTSKGLFSIDKLEEMQFLDANLINSDINVWSLYNGNSNNIWIGTYGQGLKEYKIETNTLISIPVKSQIIMPSLYLYIKSVLQDNEGFVWAGCWGSGLVRFNPTKNIYDIFINDEKNPNSLSYNDVWAIYEDSKDNLWIATNGGGLNLFDRESQMFYRLLSNTLDSLGLSSNSVYSICESKYSPNKNDDDEIVLWVGTSNGLNKVVINNSDRFNGQNQLKAKVKLFTVKNDLFNNSIKSIVEDKNGKLWLGTSNGLSEFDPVTEKFSNYSVADGLEGNSFNFGSSYRTYKGSIILGGANGLDIFKPTEITKSDFKAPVYITDFQLFNEAVSAGDNSPLKTNIIQASEIALSYDQNIFSFRFSALDYNSPKSIQYAYKLEGFDEDWIYSGRRRYAAYTNLNPGTYTFLVKSTNSDGIWNENARSIKVIIQQPWWKTGWALSVYVLIIGLGLYWIRRFEINRTQLRNELKMREFETQKLREIENVKSRFFANLSHEFRTPLMLIKGPLEQLKDGEIKENIQDHYEMIYRNTENLHTLIDQLLELTQLEVEAIPIRTRKENIIIILKGIFESFKSIAAQKNILTEFSVDDSSICAWVDRDKLEKIINNLLSNAVKFTPNGGVISLSVKVVRKDENEFAEIKISDTGIGIPEEKLNKIFDRFFQVDDSSGRAYGGSGIGLSLVKELVDLHKWEIKTESIVGKGTSFVLTIPLSENYLSEKEKIDEDSKVKNPDEVLLKESKIEKANDEIKISQSIKNANADKVKYVEKSENMVDKPLILIVDDSSDVRDYIISLLEPEFNTLQAENAEIGISKALDIMPDLILSDIMMPGTDGLEFCKQIKTNIYTSHIPVILLTAKVSQSDKIEGLETGADDYVTKPFNYRELSARIRNLLEQRKRLKEKFRKEINFKPDLVTANSLDKEFLEKAFKIVEENLYDTEFDIEHFAEKMFISRSQLHRKMIAVTGQAPGEFVRIFKLKKAAQLLLEKKLSITQIALEVGFSSPSHFTKAFLQYFNCLPSEFILKNNSK